MRTHTRTRRRMRLHTDNTRKQFEIRLINKWRILNVHVHVRLKEVKGINKGSIWVTVKDHVGPMHPQVIGFEKQSHLMLNRETIKYLKI